MKIIHYSEAKSKKFNEGPAKNVTGRVVIGKADEASNFCMRVFKLDKDGHTPRHSHDWEHEIFFHSGEGEIWRDGTWIHVSPGFVAFIPGGEEHQIRNAGDEPLRFVCLVPAGAPQL